MDRALLKEIQDCPKCWLYDYDNQYSTRRREAAGEVFEIWTLPNGMTLGLGHGLGSVPLHSDFVLCPDHELRAKAGLADEDPPVDDEPPFGSFPEERGHDDLQGAPYKQAVEEIRQREDDDV